MANFQVNEQVMHCRDGLSVITGTKEMGGKSYFLVQAKHSDTETIYVPCRSAHRIIRPIMAVKQADALLKKMKTIVKEFNPNTKQRRDGYKKRLASGNVEDMLYLYAQKRLFDLDPSDVKLGAGDLDMLNYATNFVLDEFAITYGVKREEIATFINSRLLSLK